MFPFCEMREYLNTTLEYNFQNAIYENACSDSEISHIRNILQSVFVLYHLRYNIIFFCDIVLHIANTQYNIQNVTSRSIIWSLELFQKCHFALSLFLAHVQHKKKSFCFKYNFRFVE